NVGYSCAKIAIDINMIKEADRLGFHSVWSAEAYGSDAVTPLAWIAGQTEHIQVASGLMQIPARPPAMTALTASPVDQLSRRRLNPTYRLAIATKSVEYIVETADGWLTIFYSPYRNPPNAALEAGFARAGGGKSLATFDVAPSVTVIVGDDVQACLDFIKPFL